MNPVLVLRHQPHIGLGFAETVFDEMELAWRYVDLFDSVPENLDIASAAGLIVLGGTMHVDQLDRYPMLGQDLRWIDEALEAKRPLLGICLGSQLLAKALGAEVTLNRVREIGWYRLTLSEAARDDPLFSEADQTRQTVFHFHSRTFSMPEGAVPLGQTETCSNQAFRYGPAAWGLQFHPEMTRPMIDDWLGQPGCRRLIDEIDYLDRAEIEQSTPVELPKMHRFSRKLFSRFAEVVKQNHGPSS